MPSKASAQAASRPASEPENLPEALPVVDAADVSDVIDLAQEPDTFLTTATVAATSSEEDMY